MRCLRRGPGTFVAKRERGPRSRSVGGVGGGVDCGRERLTLATGMRQRGTVNVVRDVEIGDLDPLRRLQIEQMGPQHLPEARQCHDPFREAGCEVVEVGQWSLDDGHPADRQTDVPVGILRLQEAGIQRRQVLCRHRTAPCDRQIMVGIGEWCSRLSPVEPSSVPLISPRPRLPTTTSCASAVCRSIASLGFA